MSDWTPGEALFFAVLFSIGAALMVWSATDSTGWHRATDLAAVGFMSVSVGLALRQAARARTSGDDDDDVA